MSSSLLFTVSLIVTDISMSQSWNGFFAVFGGQDDIWCIQCNNSNHRFCKQRWRDFFTNLSTVFLLQLFSSFNVLSFISLALIATSTHSPSSNFSPLSAPSLFPTSPLWHSPAFFLSQLFSFLTSLSTLVSYFLSGCLRNIHKKVTSSPQFFSLLLVLVLLRGDGDFNYKCGKKKGKRGVALWYFSSTTQKLQFISNFEGDVSLPLGRGSGAITQFGWSSSVGKMLDYLADQWPSQAQCLGHLVNVQHCANGLHGFVAGWFYNLSYSSIDQEKRSYWTSVCLCVCVCVRVVGRVELALSFSLIGARTRPSGPSVLKPVTGFLCRYWCS